MKKLLVAVTIVATTSTCISAKSVGDEIGINLGLNSINNEDSLNFKNFKAGLTYQIGDIDSTIKPRFDLDIVKISDYYDERVKYLYKGSVNGILPINTNSNFEPYLLAGGGYEIVDESLKDQFESAPFIQGGAGVSYNTNKNFSINFESKALKILGKDNQENEIIVGVGIKIPLGSKAPAVKKTANNDKDGDGVVNAKDRCPNTPKGFRVDINGCAKSVRLNINFDAASYRINSNSIPKIQEFANYLRMNKSSRATIEGHTDSRGGFSYNQNLSTKRAQSVVNQLVALGISRSRLSYIGYGESKPISTNQTMQGRALNRRIEAKISNKAY